MRLVQWIDAKTDKLSPKQMDRAGLTIIWFNIAVVVAGIVCLILALNGTLK